MQCVWAVSTHWCCSGPQIPLGAFTCPCSASPVGLDVLAVQACVFLTAPCSHHPPFGTIWSLSPAGCPEAVCGCWNNRSGVWVRDRWKPFPSTKSRSDDKDKKVQVHWFTRALSHSKLCGTITFLNTTLGGLVCNVLGDVMHKAC